MTKITAAPRLDFRATLEIDEGEARFLDAIIGYGGQALIDVVKKHLGTAYIRDHEAAGLRFCETARQQLGTVLYQFEDARKVFTGDRIAVERPPVSPEHPADG